MHLEEKKLESNIIYDGKIIRVEQDTVLLENEQQALREVVRHPGGVCIAALDDNEYLYFVKQFRYPYYEAILELPAGKLDRRHESPLAAGKRELQEETGMLAQNYYDLGKLYPSPGYCDEIISLYAATGLMFQSQALDEDEFLDVVKIPFVEAVNMTLEGKIKDAKSQTAILKLKLFLDNNSLAQQVTA